MKTKPLQDERAEQYIQNLVKGMPKRQAYREAFHTNAKPRSIDTLANRLFKKVDVRLRYDDLLSTSYNKAAKKLQPKAEESTDVAAAIIGGWLKILKTDVMDLMEWQADERGKEYLVLRRDVKDLDTFAVQEVSYDSNGNIRLKLYSKTEAMKALAELYQIQGDKEASSVRIEIPDELEGMAD